jgi:hypothetical protein
MCSLAFENTPLSISMEKAAIRKRTVAFFISKRLENRGFQGVLAFYTEGAVRFKICSRRAETGTIRRSGFENPDEQHLTTAGNNTLLHPKILNERG